MGVGADTLSKDEISFFLYLRGTAWLSVSMQKFMSILSGSLDDAAWNVCVEVCSSAFHPDCLLASEYVLVLACAGVFVLFAWLCLSVSLSRSCVYFIHRIVFVCLFVQTLHAIWGPRASRKPPGASAPST